MASPSSAIPVLDCRNIGLDVKEDSVNSEDIKQFGDLLKNAFATSGVCYLINHGLEKRMIESFMEISKKYFSLPLPVKQQRTFVLEKNFGWVAMEQERSNTERPGDLKETFNYTPAGDTTGEWPEAVDFGPYYRQMYQTCTVLARRLCGCLSVGMGLGRNLMPDAHAKMGSNNNLTCLRTLYYPPIEEGDSSVKPGQIRLGEHSDYGTITLLFQDDIGGLEAKIPGQGFVPVTPIPDTIVVITGDLMQRWTSDQLMAIKHRVLIPEMEVKRKRARQSVVFFIYPDDDYIISPLDGSNKYEPVSCKEYREGKLNATY